MSGNSAAGGVSADWSGFTVSNIWDMVKDETREHGYTQVAVWQRISDLCTRHADTVEKAATRLKEGWPATPGSAAELFQRNLSVLVDSLRDTARVATNNARELQGVTEHIIEVQQRIAPLAHEQPPVSSIPMAQGETVRQRQLNIEAQQIMRTTEPTATASAYRLQTPRAYEQKFKTDDFESPDESDPTRPGSGGSLPQGSGYVDIDPLRPSWSTGASPSEKNVGSGPHLAGEVAPDMPAGPDTFGTRPDEWGTKTTPFTDGGYGSHAPPGRIVGSVPGGPSTPVTTPYGHAGAAGRAANGGVPGHGAGGFVGGVPMAAGGGRPVTTSDGVRVGRPGGVIGDRRRHPPYDPDDPWAIDPEVVEPIIGGPRTMDRGGADDDGPPAGVVEIRGWPR